MQWLQFDGLPPVPESYHLEQCLIRPSIRLSWLAHAHTVELKVSYRRLCCLDSGHPCRYQMLLGTSSRKRRQDGVCYITAIFSVIIHPARRVRPAGSAHVECWGSSSSRRPRRASFSFADNNSSRRRFKFQFFTAQGKTAITRISLYAHKRVILHRSICIHPGDLLAPRNVIA